MSGNPDSGKPRIHPGMSIESSPWRNYRYKIKPIPRATKRPRIVPIPRAPLHRKGAKRSKDAGMFRRDI